MNISGGALPNVTIYIQPSVTYGIHNIPQIFQAFFIAAFVINFLFGLPANSYVLWLIITGAGSGVASEFFVLSLSVSEIIYCLSTVLDLLGDYISLLGLPVLVTFCRGFLFTGRPLFQCCVCVERYLAVIHPVAFLKYRPLRYRVACSAVIWLLTLGSCLGSLYIGVYLRYLFLAQYVVYFSVKSFCCLAVLRALKQPGPGEGGREREGENHMKKRAFRIILTILVCMVVNYMPVFVLFSLESFIAPVIFYSVLSIFLSIIKLTGFVQPLLYLHRAGKLPFIRGL